MTVRDWIKRNAPRLAPPTPQPAMQRLPRHVPLPTDSVEIPLQAQGGEFSVPETH